MSKKIEPTAEDIAFAETRLRELFPIDSYVSTVVRYVSRDGLTQSISILAVTGDERQPIADVSWMVARVLDVKLHRTHRGVVAQGGQMNLAHDVVYRLARRLYPSSDRPGYALTHNELF